MYSTGLGSQPYSVAVLDFNNDTRLDIAVANYGTNSVGVLFGDGNGSFASQLIFQTGFDSHPFALVIGDVNNDNLTDIVATNDGYDSNYSTIPLYKLTKVIKYAVYNCLAASYLQRVVMINWTFKQFKQTKMDMLLTDPSLNTIQYELEDISDDEITDTTTKNNNDNAQQQDNDELIVNMFDTDSLFEHPTQSNVKHRSVHARRSATARKQRNKKRNIFHRRRRYIYHLIRALDPRFKMYEVKNILHQFKVQYVHIKPVYCNLIIGVKNEELWEQYHRLLPNDIFANYSYDRRH